MCGLLPRERRPHGRPRAVPEGGSAEALPEKLQRTRPLRMFSSRSATSLSATQAVLRTTREQYGAATEDLRAANEELQSINEEYRSTAEELETSKEELQSINEELQTVNSELKLKLDMVRAPTAICRT